MPGHPRNVELLVKDGELAHFELVELPALPAAGLAEGDVLVRVEKFGFSANNVTYAALGRALDYFAFFPAARTGWGKIPVWGMGAIVASRHPGLAVGTRLYGYLPLARFVTLRPARMTPLGFDVDRGSLPAVYNQYILTASDPFYVPGREDHMMIFRPLFLTDFLLDDYLADGHDWFGADTVVVTSASSKTAYGLAFMLARRRAAGGGRPITAVGLTSAGNAPFVAGLGLYDRVVTYDELDALPRTSAVAVDVAGNAEVLARLGAHLGERLHAIVTVGMSHWDKVPAGAVGGDFAAAAPGGPRSEFFFAPTWAAKRQEDWGLPGMVERIAVAWREFLGGADARCRLQYGSGRDAVAATYRAMLAGGAAPDRGQILSLWDDAF